MEQDKTTTMAATEEEMIIISKGEYKGSVHVEYLTEANFAMSYNHIPILGYVEIENNGGTDWKDVTIEISGERISTSRIAIPFIEKGVQIQVKDLSIEIESSVLLNLTEGIDSSFTLKITSGEEEIFCESFPIHLMAFAQWSGTHIRPEMISAFVTPNHPLITKVLNDAAEELQKETGSSALDGYLTQNYDRARKIVAAIYRALKRQSLIYAVPPASFEKSGQRVRLSDEVLSGKIGTCLDLTLLMASCVEAVGMHPVIVMFNCHSLLGVWLCDDMSPRMIIDDASFLTKSAADGVNSMVLVESTCLTDNTTGFEKAVETATKEVRDSETEDPEMAFEMFVDVARCRLEHIAPMPQRIESENGWTLMNDGIQHAENYESTSSIVTYSDPKPQKKVFTKQEIWERKLLDMTMNNRLLKMVTGGRLIQFCSFEMDRLEDSIRSGEEIRITYDQFDLPVYKGIQDSQVICPEHKDVIARELGNRRLISMMDEVCLNANLKNISRISKNIKEETGANSLFIAIGAMRYFEDEISERPVYAPLLLIPVNIYRKSGIQAYVIKARDEETMFNTTLREYLRQTFKIEIGGIDPLPTDDSGLDVKRILAMVRKSIANQPRWNVLDECFLGIFSFSKFVMWNDIHTNADKMKDNKVISSLLNGKLEWADDEMPADARQTDKDTMPSDFALPVDADSSQLEAVIESGAGKSFILHGPPGTGKSQTITNIIANALYHGKRVLFVAEKMAALSVVQSRLEKIGIGPFCLELHSNTATKEHVLKQFDEALNVRHIVSDEKYEKTSEELFARRQELISVIDAMHTKGDNGLSVYDCIIRCLASSGTETDISSSLAASFSDKSLADTCEKVKDLDTIISIIGAPKANLLYGLFVNDCSSEYRSALKECLESIHGEVESVLDIERKCYSISGEEIEDTYESLNRLQGELEKVAETDSIRKALISDYGSAVLEENAENLRRTWNQISSEGMIGKFFDSRKLLKRLRTFSPFMKTSDINGFIRKLETFHEKEGAIQEYYRRRTDFDAASASTKIKSFLSAVRSSETICTFDKAGASFCSSLFQDTERWISGLNGLKNWLLWCTKIKPLYETGIGSVIEVMAEEALSGKEAAEMLRKSVYHRLAVDGIDSSFALRSFNGRMLEDVINKYRELTDEFAQMTRQELFHKLASNVPQTMNEIVGSSEIGILKRNISNGGRGTSIRKLMDQIPTLLPKLCPCMLMSPLSVAEYINLQAPKFDIVIFDEASQMPTSEAVGAIARGKSLIVVGDPKQMPPTDFFQKTAVSEDEADIDDMESILDDCIALSIPSRYLTWHYRSRHESLIAFSNAQYYDGRLLTFPSVDDRKSKVTLVPVEGVYLKGGTNKTEAKAIVDEIISRLKDPELQKQSIGVVSFNVKQQMLIDDMLTDILDKNAELRKLAYDCPEPIFIKNLENVQGDERDVIIFSVGYGPDAKGNVSMNFGPLNQHGGQRRLNVAVSRARCEMKVFSMLRGKDIDLRKTHAQGVVGLKNFLDYAERGSLLAGRSQTEQAAEASIDEQIAAKLNAAGLEAVARVGRSNFRIDVGIVDPSDPSKYILGILCDGEKYYETKTERDREVVQPSVLERLGWRIMKVWTMDWFEDSDKVVAEIMAKVKEIEGNPDPPCDNVPQKQQLTFNAASIKEVLPEDRSAKEYVSADIRFKGQCTARQALVDNETMAAHHLACIVKTEAPVNNTLLYRRIREIWGIQRMTPQAKLKVDTIIQSCGVYSVAEPGGMVYWNSEEEAKSFDFYRTGGRQDINEIPIVEICVAMKFLVEEQIGISREDLAHFTALRFGIARAGSNVDARCSEALSQLISSGALCEKEGKIVVN